MRVKWLRTANSNLDAVVDYIARDNPVAARAMYHFIRSSVASLAEHPEKGRPGRVFGTRELVLDGYPYIIPYRIRDGEVQVLRIFHTSQRPPDTW